MPKYQQYIQELRELLNIITDNTEFKNYIKGNRNAGKVAELRSVIIYG